MTSTVSVVRAPAAQAQTARSDAVSIEHRAAVEVALVRLAVGSTTRTVVVSLACALFAMLALWPTVDQLRLSLWFGAMLVSSGLRLWLSSRPSDDLQPRDVTREKAWLEIWAIQAGLLWAAPAYLFLSSGAVNEMTLLFIAFLIVGVAGAIPVLHAACFGAAVSFEAALLLSFALRLVTLGDRLHVMEACGTLCYFLVMIFGCWRSHDMLRRALTAERLAAQSLARQLRNEEEYRRLIDKIPDPILRYDSEGNCLQANQAALALSGLSLAELQGQPSDLKLPCGPALTLECVRQVVVTGRPAVAETVYRTANGRTMHFHVHFGPEVCQDGRVEQVFCLMRDVSDQKRYEAELKAHEELEAELSSLAANVPGFIYTMRQEGRGHSRVLYASPAIQDVLGESPEEAAYGGLPRFRGRIHAEDRLQYETEYRHAASQLTQVRIDVRYAHPHKGERWLEIRSTPKRVDGAILWHGLMIDVTQRKQIEQALAEQQREFRSLAQNLPDVIIRYDRHGKRTYINPALGALTGCRTEVLLGQTLTEANLPGFEPVSEYVDRLQRVVAGGEAETMQATYNHEGVSRVFQVTLTPERAEDGQVIGALAIFRDISESFAYQEYIQSLAFYDVLTGLPNRTLFNEKAIQAVVDAERNGERMALIMMDLDHFKEINDILGHGAGDELLRSAANRIRGTLRASDTVARFGGDEFALILPHVRDSSDLGVVASNLLRTLGEPYQLDGREYFVSVSIGIALYPDNGSDSGTLLKYADSALYLAKGKGRNNFQFYSPDLTLQAQERMALEGDLRRSLAHGELAVHYQPKVHLESGHVIGAEALLRWFHPQRGGVPPDRFIGIAEDTGLIIEIGNWVLRSACEAAVAWNRSARDLRRIAVNLSPRQFHRHDVLHTVLTTLEETGCRPEWIELEITEGLLLEDRDDIRECLTALHRAGISIAIDDFGTGYSALSYLNRFPISTLKIDRSFVADVPGKRGSAALVEAILALARSMGMTVVAEGVESDHQAEWLTEIGCDQGQGFLWSKPLAAEHFSQRFFPAASARLAISEN